MEIKYYQYEISKNELGNDRFSVLGKDDKSWAFVDRSDKDKIVIHSGHRIDDLLNEIGIEHTYCGLKCYERKERDERKIPIVVSAGLIIPSF
ncbi:MAG: hypothetical protein WC584_02765 [Candidatus Pacearchaeota archaeon]